MPWVATERTPRDIGLPPRVEPEKATPDLAEPGIVDTLGAAFRSQNIVGSTLSNRMIGADLDTVDPDFDPFEAAKGTQYEQYPERLAQLYNRRAYDAFTSQVDMEMEDRRTLDAAGVWGIVAQIGAGVVDPTILIPAGSLIRSGKVGYSVARSAAAVGAGTAAGVAVQEGALQATQETRTAAESAMAIGGGAVLGSLLGAAGAKLLDNVAWNSLSSRLSKELAERGPLPIDVNDAEMKALVDGLATGPASAGAAAVTRATINDLTIAGRAAAVAARPVAQLNPLLRALTSPSARAREIMLSLMENPVYLKANEGTAERAGMASEQAVETLVKTSQGKFIVAYEQAINDWKAMNKAGARISWADYRRRVGQAMRNNDTDPGGSEFITRSAQQFRREVFDPLKERAIAEGLLPEDVEVATAPSYFTRVYNVPKIEAKEQEFKQIVRQWAQETLNAQAKAGDVESRLSDLERESYIEDVVTSIYNKITGRETDAIAQDFIRIPAAARGPLKERTFNIEDAKIAAFLEDDIDEVGRRYTRSMGADVEVKAMLARRGAEKFEDLIKEIQDDYAEMRKGVTDERELKQINARERSDIKDLKAVHAMLKGAYLPEQNSGNWAKVVNAAMTFNYIRAMGGVVLSSLTDVARPLMVHGLGRYMNDGVAPLVKNLKAVRMSSREAKLAGVVGERVRNAMLATYSEVTDPYSRSSPFERMMENVARGFSRATGMPYWNDFMKTVSGVMTQNRVLDNAARWGAVGEKEQRYMRFLGIDQPMAERIAAQFAQHGDTLDGVRVANTEDWTDDVAVRAYRAAIAKDVDSIIVTKGIGDVPLFAHTPTGRALLQFKGFALASHQRALVRGLQEDKANMVAGLIAMTAIGSFIYWLKSVESNRAQDISDNPGRWIAEGLDRSGFLAIPFEVNNTMEKIGAPGLYTGLQAMFPSATQKAPASRYAVRSVVDAALGPTVGLAKDVVDMLAAATKMDLTEADVNTMRRLTPGASLPVIRSLIEYEASPALKEAVR